MYKRQVDASGWLALPAGLGRLVGAEYLAVLAPASVAPQIKIAVAAALGIGFLASVLVLFSRSPARGRGLAGLALASVLVWGAGLSTALVPPTPSESPDASCVTSAGEDDASAAQPEDTDPAGESNTPF